MIYVTERVSSLFLLSQFRVSRNTRTSVTPLLRVEKKHHVGDVALLTFALHAHVSICPNSNDQLVSLRKRMIVSHDDTGFTRSDATVLLNDELSQRHVYSSCFVLFVNQHHYSYIKKI